LNAQGAGIAKKPPVLVQEEEGNPLIKPLPQVTPQKDVPAIASKTTKARDIYIAQQGQGEFGVEMKSLTRPLRSIS
jgi:hypothetical protein